MFKCSKIGVDPPRVKDPNVYGLDIKPSVKARNRRAASCGENPEIRGPQMNNTRDLIKEFE